MRLHPYHSGRIVARSPKLAPLGPVAGRHHERTDGSGYPAGVHASELDSAACVLAAADVLHALGEPRPHRPALDPAAASRVLAGLPLDRDAVRAVLDAAGAPPPAFPPLPADLTERELEVLRRLVAGRTKRQIAAELVISASTVHTHTVHIYAKCSVSTRAGLAMFAMQTAWPRGPAERRGQDRPNGRWSVRGCPPTVAPRQPTRGGTISTATAAHPDVAVVRAGFEAFANGDVAAFGAMFRDDATWHHRNDDRLGGVHRGRDGILAFIGESAQLTAGTLRAVPDAFMADGEGRVSVLVRVSGTRPDGRSFDNPQILLFGIEGDRVRSVDQFVGDPGAVAAFWA